MNDAGRVYANGARALELIIVDEPAVGLDPEERNRFLSLLAEIGENAVIAVSTHIVEAAADLGPRMAVPANGRIRLEGAPVELISTRLVARRAVGHGLSDTAPGNGFTAVEDHAEDVHLATLAQSRCAA